MISPRLYRMLTAALIAAGMLLVVFFGLRAFRAFGRVEHGPRPAAADPAQIRGWMTIPYIAQTYHVPEDVLFEALGMQANENNRRKSLADINRELNPGEAEYTLNLVRQAITDFRASHPQPEAPPPRP